MKGKKGEDFLSFGYPTSMRDGSSLMCKFPSSKGEGKNEIKRRRKTCLHEVQSEVKKTREENGWLGSCEEKETTEGAQSQKKRASKCVPLL